ncbi:DUF58 domain-containing protein [bacterium]|nr:DUF58 domain-containing protein [bacterium]
MNIILLISLIVLTIALALTVFFLFRSRRKLREAREHGFVGIPKDILRRIRKLDIMTRRWVNDVFSGEYHSVFKGRGMEFAEVREYQVGDDIRAIDWNVTARMGKPYIKIFEEERELTVMLLVDISSSGEFGTVSQMKREIALEICALLAFSAIQNNDKVGLIMFTDIVEKFVPPKKGKTHVLRLLRELLYNQPKDRETNIAEALDYMNRVLTRKGIVFLVSDFIAEDYKKPLAIASQRHDLVPIIITDPREESFPKVGFIELEDAETGERMLLDSSDYQLRKKFTKNIAENKLKREKIFKSIGLDTIDVYTDKPYIDPLVAFFKQRAKRY